MKKILVILITLFLASNLFAKDFEGIVIPADQTIDNVIKDYMINEWAFSFVDNSIRLSKDNQTFCGHNIDNIEISGTKGFPLDYCGIFFSDVLNNYSELLDFVNTVMADYGPIIYTQEITDDYIVRKFTVDTDNDFGICVVSVGTDNYYKLSLAWKRYQ